MEEARRLGGRYELGSVLGRGGMAEVYLAHDTRLGRSVAVKTLRADLARDPSFQARFRREAQSAASLNHPAIVAVYDTGEDYVDGVSLPYIVMEHVDGSTLRELLHSGRRLLPERTLEMTVGILQALEYSHRNGIVHRDIKPANVMLTRTGQVKVMDFGIARAMGDSGMTMTQTSAVIGTAQYLSPEQAKGEQVDARSDLYSTGCLLYELLTVRPPFIGDSPVAVAYQHVREEPQTPSVFDPEITPEMDAIVLKALVKDPDYRYQSADEMRADIEACLDGQPVAATAAMGAVGYGGYGGQHDQPTAAMHQGGAGAPTSMLPPVNPDDGGYDGYDDRQGRRRGNQKKKTSTSTVLLAVAGVLVLIGAILIGKSVFGGSDAPLQVEVPQLVGKTLEEAQTQTENSHLKLEQTDSKRCDVPKGSICSQTPDSGKLAEGETVQVVVSEGAPQVKVPDVTEKQKESATDVLEGENFRVETKEEESDSATPGTVLSQDPASGAEVEKGSTVTLTIAKQAKVTVPDVTGNALADAQTRLTAFEFTVTQTQVDSDEPAGTVVKQSPSGNTKADKGSQVSLEISNGPKEPEAEKVTIPKDGIKFNTVGAARGILEGLGLQVSVPENTSDDARVLDTDPGGGTELNKGDTVTLSVLGNQNGNGGNNGNGNGGNNSGFIGGLG
ncbi:Stk1 family PASTA domain-containing Ser/Thr kinase [Streptomyces sp. NPDC012623]|uniref:Stk1 family PASTA domain-containing Ser/Thr kinase n=1 Tax=unclassified Streptomyces TaxID=2593676 RepID=UPI0036AE8119